MRAEILDAIAREMKRAQDECLPVVPFTSRFERYDLDAGYEVGRRVHAARLAGGARTVGRKLGFTNPAIWDTYNVHAPVWSHLYSATVTMLEGVRARCPLAGLAEPRIEPEIVLGFRTAPAVGATPRQIVEALEWVAHGFEVVQSHFPGWKFRAPDIVADQSAHARLFVGPAQPVSSLGRDPVLALASFKVFLECDGEPVEEGRGANVIGSPLGVIDHLTTVIARQGRGEALRAGELVTTGTLTAAWPVKAGQVWRTRLEGVDLPGLEIQFV